MLSLMRDIDRSKEMKRYIHIFFYYKKTNLQKKEDTIILLSY